MSSYLVTGGAGFIGSHLVDALVGRGDDVVVVDDLSNGSREHVPAEAELVEADVADAPSLEQAFQRRRFEAVLNVAGQASIAQSFAHPERDLRTNVTGTLNVITACIEHRVPRLVHASSMTVYGEPEAVPTPETAPCRPVSYYGVTKYAAERYVHVAGARTDVDLDVTSLRMFNVYGERQRLDNPYQGVLAIFMGNLLRGDPITIHSDGRQTRDFVYVADVVDAWLRLLDDRGSRNRVYNVGSGRETPIAELADAVLAGFGVSTDTHQVERAPAQQGDLRRSGADVSALKSTGWRARTSFEDGMRRTIAWARAASR
ncbi:MAG: NAD-dependent epimerase/dehydratase family protein [Actinobacteria bacterium]|nr:MAG: NAD-dependent epimerase/dehydratase family protein [Actinomycetota bacterium]